MFVHDYTAGYEASRGSAVRSQPGNNLKTKKEQMTKTVQPHCNNIFDFKVI